GLDFVAITDHNTIEGFKELRGDLDFLVIPGLEITFDRGHLNVFGMDTWRDWMDGICGDQIMVSMPTRYQSINELTSQINNQGYLNSINHPLLDPWDWRYEDTDLRRIHCVELWNDLYWPPNASANPKFVRMWSNWLNAGHRITAIGGSDYHVPPRPEENKFGERLGYPTTFVYADELSVTGIAAGLRQQRAYVSQGPEVNFKAKINGQIFGIGADVGEQEGKITFEVTIFSELKITQAQLVKNGQVFAEAQVDGNNSPISFSDSLNADNSVWYRLDIAAPDGQVLAITNPIYTGPRREPTLFKYSDFVSER
ncbi:MAG: CehA/McbA family metallohydrolase, partial [Chloroflexi bacterium]|nr:CehA/McbA family metallohydrolase [Chloroflexota bacterium]